MNNPPIKPTNETIVINGDVYVKLPDQDYLFGSLYVNRFKQRRVMVESAVMGTTWRVNLVGGFIWMDDLRFPITVNENEIPVYFTQAQDIELDILLTETLQKTR